MGSIDDLSPLLKSSLTSGIRKAPDFDLADVLLHEKQPLDTILTTNGDDDKYLRLVNAMKEVLDCCGENLNREGLLKTPQRAAKALLFFTSGYTHTLEEVIGDAMFDETSEGGMVIVKDIDFMSMCEHHMVCFDGVIHIAYLPRRKVIGLSKLVRIAELYSRRFQLQERLGTQIANALMEVLDANGVAVMIEAKHKCMTGRGVQRAGASTSTTAFLGAFEAAERKMEFFAQIRR